MGPRLVFARRSGRSSSFPKIQRKVILSESKLPFSPEARGWSGKIAGVARPDLVRKVDYYPGAA
jgi:hypothetical protein